MKLLPWRQGLPAQEMVLILKRLVNQLSVPTINAQL